MAKRSNHYEAAFEEYLRARQIPYIAVDEAKRARLGGATLKSLDFIVSPAVGPSWLVDVKGRQFPSGNRQKQYWRNWSTRDDLRGLTGWQQLLGRNFQGLFVFAYQIVQDRSPVAQEHLFAFRDRWYGFVGITLSDYGRMARPLSAAWDTLSMPASSFRAAASAVDEFFFPAVPPKENEHFDRVDSLESGRHLARLAQTG